MINLRRLTGRYLVTFNYYTRTPNGTPTLSSWGAECGDFAEVLSEVRRVLTRNPTYWVTARNLGTFTVDEYGETVDDGLTDQQRRAIEFTESGARRRASGPLRVVPNEMARAS